MTACMTIMPYISRNMYSMIPRTNPATEATVDEKAAPVSAASLRKVCSRTVVFTASRIAGRSSMR